LKQNNNTRTGPFEGFFVSSMEFCKFKFDDKDRKDINRDINTTGTQGPPGPQGLTGSQGERGLWSNRDTMFSQEQMERMEQ
jgi:hypothetical protein